MTRKLEQAIAAIDDSTPTGRAHHWRLWYAAPRHQRSQIPVPPCFTCGKPPIGTFTDGSPMFRHYHERTQQ